MSVTTRLSRTRRSAYTFVRTPALNHTRARCVTSRRATTILCDVTACDTQARSRTSVRIVPTRQSSPTALRYICATSIRTAQKRTPCTSATSVASLHLWREASSSMFWRTTRKANGLNCMELHRSIYVVLDTSTRVKIIIRQTKLEIKRQA